MGPPDSASEQQLRRESPSSAGHGAAGVDSLGLALAGMHVGGGGAVGSSAGSASPGQLSSSGPYAVAPRDNDWGNFADAAQAAFPSPGIGNNVSPNAGDPSSASSIRNQQAFDLFPSSSGAPKGIANDVFRFSHPNHHVPGIEGRSPQSDAGSFRYSAQCIAPAAPTPGSYGGDVLRGAQDARRRTESPSCSVTGTTTSSRSASPYTSSSNEASSGRVIQAFQRNADAVLPRNPSSFTDDDRSASGFSIAHTHSSHPSLATLDSAHRSPYAKEWTATNHRNSGSPYEHTSDRSFGNHSDAAGPPPPPAPHPAYSSTTAQPQVLYMAVPSPDGRGQVLQPVQMVQVDGKTSYVVSSNGGQSQPQLQPLEVPAAMGLPPLSHQSSQEYLGAADSARSTPIESRSRVAQYAIDGSSRRSFTADSTSPTGNEYGRAPTCDPSAPYQTDPTVAQLYAAPQRPPLDALLGQVRRLSRDQVGCRLVQQALDEEGPMAATMILNEGLQFWGEAMVDPFGNYLFQKILEKITPLERVLLVKTVSPRLVNASLNLHGTRSVQKVVELCSLDEQAPRQDGVDESAADILTAALAPAAARLCIDSHGNHVIQRILLKLGQKHTRFVFDAVAASVGDVARHRHGCCVIQRCLDSPQNEARAHLVRRIVDKSLELMQDAYGNYVVQYVLDVCSDEDVAAVCESVVGRVNLLAVQKFSSNVMEKCLERCSDRVKEHYLAEMSDPDRIRELMMDPFGNYVVQRALSVATHAQAIRLVEAMKPHLLATQTSGPHGQRSGGVRNTAGGRRIIAKICRRFPNFTLSSVASNDEIYSSSRSTHRHHPAAMMSSSYAPIGPATSLAQPQQFAIDPFGGDPFSADPRLSQSHSIPQTYYTLGGTPYYEPQFTRGHGHGGFPGM